MIFSALIALLPFEKNLGKKSVFLITSGRPVPKSPLCLSAAFRSSAMNTTCTCLPHCSHCAVDAACKSVGNSH